jgi:flagellar M-ring protein FliF
MNPLSNIWNESSWPRRSLFVGLLLVLVVLFAWAVYGVMAPSYQTLFRNLRPQDAATITAELDKQKIKYRLDDGGATILVPESQVHGARIKVLGRDLPLSGTVGFELFNNADLGLTEFAQKVNYQRALQGELARTIMSLEVVQSARVHLTMPESGYLRHAGSKPKASVAIALKAVGPLDKSTVRSIQRLVAAAVQDLELSDVAVVSQSAQGAQAASSDVSDLTSDPRLEQKFGMEDHYVRRILAHADKIFGPGRTQVTVDLVLNFDQTKVVNESTSSSGAVDRVSGAADTRAVSDRLFADRAAGTEIDVAGPGSAKATDAATPPVTRRSSQRRVEEVTVAPGAIRRINVGALVEGRVDKADLERFKALAASSIGLVTERGDNIAVFNADAVAAKADHPQDKPAVAMATDAATEFTAMEHAPAAVGKRASSAGAEAITLGLLLLLLIFLVGWIWYAQIAPRLSASKEPTLSEEDRARMVRRLSELLQERTVGQ